MNQSPGQSPKVRIGFTKTVHFLKMDSGSATNSVVFINAHNDFVVNCFVKLQPNGLH